jgi:hypothetical protein
MTDDFSRAVGRTVLSFVLMFAFVCVLGFAVAT